MFDEVFTVVKQSKVLVLTFLPLCLLATLFPPFIWGREVFQDGSISYTTVELPANSLPFKKYTFLFGDSKQKLFSGVFSWDDIDGKRSLPTYVTAHRRLLVSELVLEYVLALIAAAFLASMFSIAKNSRQRARLADPASRNSHPESKSYVSQPSEPRASERQTIEESQRIRTPRPQP